MFRSKDIDLIDRELSKFYSKFLSETTENLRQLVLDSPTQLSEVSMKLDLTRLNLKFQKDSEFQTLAIMSWYFPEEIRFLVQMELHQSWRAQSLEVKEVLLTSKDYALTWLMRVSRWTESDFFGNYLNKSFVRKFEFLSFKKLSRKKVPRYSGYCRGYQDTNRGVPSSLRLEHWAKSSVSQEIQRHLEREQLRNYLFNKIEEELSVLLVTKNLKYLSSF